jgi:nucleotide-binding universal stress UspA family protein
MFKTVLFPVDQSRESREAAEKVINIVKTYGARLVILSVVEPPAEEGDAPLREEVMTSPEAVAKLLSDAQAMFSQQGIKAEIIEREGKPAFTICDVADEIGADLIVMGCRGMGLTDDGASESVTNRVINLSPCAVLIVP